MEEKSSFNVKFLIMGICFSLLTLGVVDHVWNIDENLCEMTYMWEPPSYIPVPLPAAIVDRFPRYKLFSYGEGRLSEDLATGKYSGQPVIFIPGNGGSYKQVRSLASVAYRKRLDDDGSDWHYDFFAADLAEDLAALYGPSLQLQTEFVSAIIEVVQSLYLQSKPVVLVGHSMGGMVARAVLLSDSIDSASIPLILTLATPHTAPPLALDGHIQSFYDKVNSYWSLFQAAGPLNTSLISVGGGRNDVLVSPLSVRAPQAHLVTTTTAVPGCWATTDHLSVVWCKQFVLATVRALHDSLDHKTGLITTNHRKLKAVFEYHYITRYSGKKFTTPRQHAQMRISSGARWTEFTKRQFTQEIGKIPQHSYLMIPLSGQPKNDYISATVRVWGLDEKHWVFACAAVQAESKSCMSGANLSKHGRLLGGKNRKSKMVDITLRPLIEEGYTHLVVSVPPSEHPVTVSVDIHGDTNRKSSVVTPRLLYSFRPSEAIEMTPKNAILHRLTLEGLNEAWHSYDLLLKPSTNCPLDTTDPPTVLLPLYSSGHVAQAMRRTDGVHHIFRIEQDEVFAKASDRADVYVDLALQPKCSYNVAVKASMSGAFRRIFVLYGPQLPAFILAQLFLGLANQMKSVGTSRYCPSLITALLSLTPLMVVPFVKLSALIMANVEVANDQQVLVDSGLDMAVLPILLFFCSLPLTVALSGCLWLTVLGAGNALYSAALRIFGTALGTGEVVADIAMTGLAKVPVLVAVVLIGVAFGSCGALAISLGTVYYFIQIFDMYKDYLKKVLLKLIPKLQDETVPPEPKPATDTPAEGVTVTQAVVPQSSVSLALHLHLSLLALCLMASLLQFPSLIAWAMHTKQGTLLPADPSLPPSVLCLGSLAVLWQIGPKHERAFYGALGYGVHGLAVLCLLFASLNLFYLPYLISMALMLVALHQLLAPTTNS